MNLKNWQDGLDLVLAASGGAAGGKKGEQEQGPHNGCNGGCRRPNLEKSLAAAT
jgi:hypothetical protein